MNAKIKSGRAESTAIDLKNALDEGWSELVQLLSVDLHPTASEILDNGAKVIVSGGGGALTMRAVAKESKIKLASLQYHFKTFDELISALFLREFGVIAGIIWNALKSVAGTDGCMINAIVDEFRRVGYIFRNHRCWLAPILAN